MWHLRLILSSLALVSAHVPPEEYDQWTAQEKVAWWKEHLDVGQGGSSKVADFISEKPDKCMHPECVHPGGFNTRKDVVHRYECRMYALHPTGLVAFVKAVWLPNKYTGMFQKADFGFARWGYQFFDKRMYIQGHTSQRFYYENATLEPLPSHMTPGKANCYKYDCWNVSKGFRYDYHSLEEGERPEPRQFMALKFFRDKVPSAAIHTGFVGLPSWNHFGREYSNLLLNLGSRANDTTDGSMAEQAAERGTQWPGFTGLHDMAMFDQDRLRNRQYRQLDNNPGSDMLALFSGVRPGRQWSCGYANLDSDQGVEPQTQDREDGLVELQRAKSRTALLQTGVSTRKQELKAQAKAHGHLRNRLTLALDAGGDPKEDEKMLPDDVVVEPRSQSQHTTNWFCDGKKQKQWPQSSRLRPWVSSCKASLVPGRPVSEPEYALPDDCADLPRCSKLDGTWYSSIYPCRCGGNTCYTGQLCTSHSDSCVSWGPLSRSKA